MPDVVVVVVDLSFYKTTAAVSSPISPRISWESACCEALFLSLSGGDGDLPDPDDAVGVAGEQRLSVGAPGHAEALRRVRGGVPADLRAQLLHHVLGLQVPDLDGGPGGGAQPVAVGGEAQRVDGVGVVEGVQVLAVVEVPQHGLKRRKTKCYT